MPAVTRAAQAFCAHFRCSAPVVCAAMAGVAGGDLAAAVGKRAGGVGFVGTAAPAPQVLKTEVDRARKALGIGESDELPLGVGVCAWYYEPPAVSGSSADIVQKGDTLLRHLLFGLRAESVWLSFSIEGAAGLEKWVERVRRIEKEGPRGEGERERTREIKVVVMVMDEAAGRAAREWPVDAVIVQGTEAGGHGPTTKAGAPLLTLLRALSPIYSNTSPPFLLGAGGLCSPSSVSAAFSAGAAAVVLGTALQVADESLLKRAQKELLVQAREGETVKSGVFDLARDGRNRWPEGVDGRGLVSATTREEGGDVGKLAERYKQAVEEGDVERVITWAGTGVGDVKSIRPAAEIVRELLGGQGKL
ncbi:hypothetical protein JCM10207_005629 [Rhodosporidiobolus poonsookiae]